MDGLTNYMIYVRWGRLLTASACTVYVFSVLSNLISYRQTQYDAVLAPLPDISAPVRDLWPDMNLVLALDLLTAFTAAFSALLWFACCRQTRPIVTFTAAQMILLPFVALAQWTTVIPDALPNCIDVLGIPQDSSVGWVWYHLFPRPCGDVYWASDIGQIVLWSSLGLRSVRRPDILCGFYVIIGITAVGLALGARYQYTSGILYTLLVAVGAATHHIFESLGVYIFTYRVSEKASSEEVMRMVDMQI